MKITNGHIAKQTTSMKTLIAIRTVIQAWSTFSKTSYQRRTTKRTKTRTSRWIRSTRAVHLLQLRTRHRRKSWIRQTRACMRSSVTQTSRRKYQDQVVWITWTYWAVCFRNRRPTFWIWSCAVATMTSRKQLSILYRLTMHLSYRTSVWSRPIIRRKRFRLASQMKISLHFMSEQRAHRDHRHPNVWPTLIRLHQMFNTPKCRFHLCLIQYSLQAHTHKHRHHHYFWNNHHHHRRRHCNHQRCLYRISHRLQYTTCSHICSIWTQSHANISMTSTTTTITSATQISWHSLALWIRSLPLPWLLPTRILATWPVSLRIRISQWQKCNNSTNRDNWIPVRHLHFRIARRPWTQVLTERWNSRLFLFKKFTMTHTHTHPSNRWCHVERIYFINLFCLFFQCIFFSWKNYYFPCKNVNANYSCQIRSVYTKFFPSLNHYSSLFVWHKILTRFYLLLLVTFFCDL